ncbi:MAG TPA: molybdopterin-dependent oxidoreductase, partial [Thermomicrobiales bacterium]|nr:molybdopterin-dependent oxidoreductase [Thermomicrobiales bacterium]
MATRSPGLHLSHWGAFETTVEGGALTAIRPFAHDPDPSPLLDNVIRSARHATRVTQPMVRKGWLEHGPGPSERRGAEPFVPVSWDTVAELLSTELGRVYRDHGAPAVYGGSYGWASAGRFHHAQSQLHRFLNCLGGYTGSVDSYSTAAGNVILPRVIASADSMLSFGPPWKVLAERTDVFLCFGGLPLKNTAVSNGGVFRHRVRGFLDRAVERGAEFVLLSPQRDDMDGVASATWLPVSPGADVAVMLALAHTLITEGLHDRAFLDRYCVGFERLERYILGLDDGQPKSPEWAAPLAEIPAGTLRSLALRLAGKRVFVTTTWSLQRSEFGEQVPWMGVALAAILGQIGQSGGGYGFGYGCVDRIGAGFVMPGLNVPVLSQGRNRSGSFIPVARVSDMLLNPGAEFDYNGGRYTFPDIRLVYWAGGNPFHHHQHLAKLQRGLARVDTIVVHDPFWTASARHADIVMPSTITLERNDIGGANS